MKYSLSFFLFAASLAVYGQDIAVARLRWVTNEAIDVKANQPFALASFLTTDSNTITWQQKAGENVQSFKVVSKSGTWRDVSANGFCDFRATFLNEPEEVRFTFEKKSSGIWVTIYFAPNDSRGLIYKLKVAEVIAL
jgi:hypothetical protein